MKWNQFARRNHAPLSARLLQEAQQPAYFERATGIPGGLHNHVWLRDTIYIPDQELHGLRTAIESLVVEGGPFLSSFVTDCRKAMARLSMQADGLAKRADLSSLDPNGLAGLFEDWIASYRTAMSFVPVFRTLDHVLSAQLTAEEAADFLSGDQGHVTEEARERAELNRIVARLRSSGDLGAKSPEAERLIDQHVDSFGWLRTRWYLGEPFSRDDIRQRVLALLSASYPAAAPTRRPSRGAEEPKHSVLAELSYLRSYRAEAINKSIWEARPFFVAIGRRLGLEYQDLAHLLHYEVLDSLRGGALPSHDLIARRRQAFGTVLVEDRFAELSGDDEVDAFGAALGLSGDSDANEVVRIDVEAGIALRGVVASPGRAMGPVSVIRGQKDDGKVQDGDILVTTMTFPSLVGAMQRCAAIVTDDGGLLSHAAITARELGKPCLIGTGNATEVLADGEVVEVDCYAGVVRRILDDQGKQTSETGADHE